MHLVHYLWHPWPSTWDATLGFDGEGPTTLSSTPFTETPLDFHREHPFLTRASLFLASGSQAKGLQSQLLPGTCLDDVEHILTQLAERGNSDRPVGSRIQSFPANVSALVGADTMTASVAQRGAVYKFHNRPRQYKTPSPFRMDNDQRTAILAEVKRLYEQCDAIEPCPDHDGHLPLTQWAKPYERTIFPGGPWPREEPVPLITNRADAQQYHERQYRILKARQRAGLPRRDFEQAVFTVPKKDGGHRLCTYYIKLNKFAAVDKFQMEGVEQVATLIQPGDYGMLLDLKDCYLTLGLHPAQRRYCRFRCPDGKRWQWKTVSFGTAEAPQLCTKVLRPVIRILKSLGIRCLMYIDDLLCLDQDPLRLARAMALAMDLLQGQLGLQIKVEKGQWTPSQEFTCLGLIWNSITMQVRVPPRRIKNIQRSAVRLFNATKQGRTVATRDLARFVGQVVSCCRAIKPAKRRLLYLQHNLSKAVRTSGWRGHLHLSNDALRALTWWMGNEPWMANGHHIVEPERPLQMTLRTDAATHNVGYGGVLEFQGKTFTTAGYLTQAEQEDRFINEFEFQGMENCIRSLVPQAVPDQSLWHLIHVAVELDNFASVKYGRVAVSRSLHMSLKGARFHDWKESVGLQVSFKWLAGHLNVEADQLSRRISNHVDWRLNPWVFRRLLSALTAQVDVDLFASAANSQLPNFYTFRHDYRAVATDAMSHSWTHHQLPYGYPPPILVPRVLQKVLRESIEIILVAPIWMAQPWWPTLMPMLSLPPVLFPNEPWLVTDPQGENAWPCRWPLAAFRLSGSMLHAMESRRRFLANDGRAPKMVIIKHMTRILIASGSGGRIPDQLLRSILTAFYQG